MERPPKRYFCNKCGYVGISDTHPGCQYLAYPMAHLEQLYIDHLEAELAALRASPASALEGWKWVPVEPTQEMLNAMFETRKIAPDDADLIVQYSALLAAAPTPPVSEDRNKLELYWELLYAVANKFPGESRHQTALRYIRNAEKGSDNAAMQEDKP